MPNGRDVAAGERGEILFRGPNITPGYFNNPRGHRATPSTRDGWLHSGDVGRRDADGYYFIVDRIKDMYISGGENVYPAEVEAVLTDHRGRAGGCRHRRRRRALGRGRPCRRSACGPAQAATPRRCAPSPARSLAAYKVPKHVTVVDDYPRTAAGKVQKHLLRRTLLGE